MKSHRFAYRNLEQFDFSSAALLVVAEAGRGGSTTLQGSARQGQLRCSREGLGQAFASSETLLADGRRGCKQPQGRPLTALRHSCLTWVYFSKCQSVLCSPPVPGCPSQEGWRAQRAA